MKRTAIAVAIVAATTVPAFVATVWLFGCCVLPFHHVLHRLVPLCRIASNGHASDAQTSTPAKEKQQPAPRFTTELTSAFAPLFVGQSHPLITCSPAAYRSFLSLGGVRCDQDIGLLTFFATLLI